MIEDTEYFIYEFNEYIIKLILNFIDLFKDPVLQYQLNDKKKRRNK